MFFSVRSLSAKRNVDWDVLQSLAALPLSASFSDTLEYFIDGPAFSAMWSHSSSVRNPSTDRTRGLSDSVSMVMLRDSSDDGGNASSIVRRNPSRTPGQTQLPPWTTTIIPDAAMVRRVRSFEPIPSPSLDTSSFSPTIRSPDAVNAAQGCCVGPSGASPSSMINCIFRWSHSMDSTPPGPKVSPLTLTRRLSGAACASL
mmetsp:Transcript_11789/g.25518  ORF Transcript_11789/g.25518 Transcript_11789/m.25518 type:complete len:200 (+) Transcript_11789:736-1335(+)